MASSDNELNDLVKSGDVVFLGRTATSTEAILVKPGPVVFSRADYGDGKGWEDLREDLLSRMVDYAREVLDVAVSKWEEESCDAF